ncbi:hypothetical protein PMAYCL1PPCAC_05707, partial [Pristionchus mayeri]
LIVIIITSDVMMYVTLPLHCRLLYVLQRANKKVQLDGSFHTLMIHTTVVNLIFSLVFCFIQAPAATGVFFDFYESIGNTISHLEMIKIWSRVTYLCFAMWLMTIGISIPLMLPDSTASFTTLSLFDIPAIQYTFQGNYYQLYAVIGSFFAAVIELFTIFFCIAMIAKFNNFKKITKTNASDVRKMTKGVVRTTVAAVLTSMGSWIIVVFFVLVFSYAYSTGKALFDSLKFSAIFGAINNVLTPWVLLFSFPNVSETLLKKK